MKPRIEELEAIVRRKICAVCTERTVESVCSLEDPNHCSLFRLFPLVAEAILATQSDSVEPYLAAIREHVCSVCIDQRLDGTCPQREQVTCALDAYAVPIVDAIEEATGRSLNRVSSSL